MYETEDEMTMRHEIERLKAEVAELRAINNHDFAKLKELGWTFSVCAVCGESLSASKPFV